VVSSKDLELNQNYVAAERDVPSKPNLRGVGSDLWLDLRALSGIRTSLPLRERYQVKQISVVLVHLCGDI
jgi:hypothetical protein